MIRQNLHTHTCFDDGINSPREMVLAALNAGLSSVGFSGHSILPFANDWSMTTESLSLYLREIRQVQEEFTGVLPIYLGLEWDLLSSPSDLSAGFDYLIGSVHHLQMSDDLFSVDESAACTRSALHRHYHADPLQMAEAYFCQVRMLSEHPEVDIIGHFDLITKFDEQEPLFPSRSVEYMELAAAAADQLIRHDKIFEVNTGAMSRGYRKTPYPSADILKRIIQRGGRLTVSSDAHEASSITFGFTEAETLLKSLGCREIWEFSDSGFIPVPL